MLKNSFKKICAAVSAVAMAAQLFVMPAAHAVSIDADKDRINEDLMVDKATVTATEYNSSATTKSTAFDLGASLDKTKDFAVQFDLTLNTKQANDSGAGDGGRGRTAFYVEVQGSDANKHAGGVFHINTVTDTAATFHWKWTSTATLNGATLEYGKKYTINMLVSTANTITLTIYDADGKMLGKTEGLSMRAATCANAARLAVGLNAQENGDEASVTFENVISYNPLPDSLSVKLGNKELSTDEAYVVALPNKTAYSQAITVATTLGGKAISGYNFKTSIKMMDGKETPFALGITDGKITADLDLAGGTEAEPAVYETKLIVESKDIDGLKFEFPITFTKIELTPADMVKEYEVSVKDGAGNAAASNSAISDDITLDKGNAKIAVEWESSDEDIISSSTGVVTPVLEDKTVTLTATVSSTQDSSVEPKVVTFTYKVKGIKTLISEYVPAVKEKDGTENITSGNVTKDLVLDAGNSKIDVEWESSDEYIISSVTGIVMPTPEDTTVTLTATVSSTQDSSVEPKVVEYTYNVKGVKAIVDAAIASLKIVSDDDSKKTIDFTQSVNEDFVLPMTYSDNSAVTIEWTTDSSNVTISKNGVAELVQKTLTPVVATVKGVVSYVKNDETLYYDEVEKEFTIDMTQEDTAAKYIVRCDAAAAANFKNCPEDEEKITETKLDLPTEGIFGSDITWSSSVPTAISNTGKVTKQKNSKKVTLTAVISKGSAPSEIYTIKNLVVPSTSGSTSSSGSGSGSSSSTNSTVSSTNNKATNVSYKGTLAPNTSLQKGDITTATVSSFTDLGDAAWAKEAVTNLFNKGVINGKTASSFAPNDEITRAEFAKIVVKAFGLEDTSANVSEFSDVKAGDWYYTAVASAYNKGIIKGYANGTFGVNDKITRQDMAVIIYRAAQAASKTIAPVKDGVTFDDSADIASYAAEAVSALQKGGVINGMTATTFAPKATATRAQAAQMIYGIVK